MIVIFAGLPTLASSLLIVSWSAAGAERLICLVMLAIMTFSVYVGGMAWVPMPSAIAPDYSSPEMRYSDEMPDFSDF